MSHVKTVPAKGGVGGLSLDAAGEMGFDDSLLDLPDLGLFGDDISVEDLALDDVGLGAARHRRRRLSAKTRRKLARLAKRRSRTKKGRFAGLTGGGKKSRRRKKTTMGSLGASRKHRRRRKARLSGKLRRKLSRLAKGRKRTKKGRFAGLAGTELLSLSGGDDTMMDLFALSQAEGLGAVKHKRRRRRKHGMGAVKHRRRGGRRRHRKGGMAGLGRLANITDGLAEVEVAASMPVLGVFQWLATGPGLEALGGVALAPIVTALVAKGLSLVSDALKPEQMMGRAAGTLVSAIAMWEFGRLVGSANIAKFGAFYTIGRAIEGMVTKPYIVDKVDMLKGFLGTYRESDFMPQLGRIVLPDESYVNIGDTRRVPDTSSIGQVLLPGIKRADYAVNPLSGFGTYRSEDTATIGTVREDDTALIGDEDVDGLGVPLIPDTVMEGGEGLF
jgi:hypothetical protein